MTHAFLGVAAVGVLSFGVVVPAASAEHVGGAGSDAAVQRAAIARSYVKSSMANLGNTITRCTAGVGPMHKIIVVGKEEEREISCWPV